MDSNLLRTKSIEQLVGDVEQGSKALKRTLSALDLTLLGIGAIIGTGIFVLTGTAAEVTPVRSVDRITVGSGKPGPITTQLQRAYLDTVTGKLPDRHGWLTHVRKTATRA